MAIGPKRFSGAKNDSIVLRVPSDLKLAIEALRDVTNYKDTTSLIIDIIVNEITAQERKGTIDLDTLSHIPPQKKASKAVVRRK